MQWKYAFYSQKELQTNFGREKTPTLVYLIGEATILFSTTIQTTLHVGGN